MGSSNSVTRTVTFENDTGQGRMVKVSDSVAKRILGQPEESNQLPCPLPMDKDAAKRYVCQTEPVRQRQQFQQCITKSINEKKNSPKSVLDSYMDPSCPCKLEPPKPPPSCDPELEGVVPCTRIPQNNTIKKNPADILGARKLTADIMEFGGEGDKPVPSTARKMCNCVTDQLAGMIPWMTACKTDAVQRSIAVNPVASTCNKCSQVPDNPPKSPCDPCMKASALKPPASGCELIKKAPGCSLASSSCEKAPCSQCKIPILASTGYDSQVKSDCSACEMKRVELPLEANIAIRKLCPRPPRENKVIQSAIGAGVASGALVFASVVKKSDKEFKDVAPVAAMSAVGAGLVSAGITFAGAGAMIKLRSQRQMMKARKERALRTGMALEVLESGDVCTLDLNIPDLSICLADLEDDMFLYLDPNQLMDTYKKHRLLAAKECWLQVPFFGSCERKFNCYFKDQTSELVCNLPRDMNAEYNDFDKLTYGLRFVPLFPPQSEIVKSLLVAQLDDATIRVLKDPYQHLPGWQRTLLLPRLVIEDALKAYKTAQEYETDIDKLHRYYKCKIDCLEKQNRQVFNDTSDSFKSTVEEVERKLLKSKITPVCTNGETALAECYLQNPTRSLKCRNVVNLFMQCVESERNKRLPVKQAICPH